MPDASDRRRLQQRLLPAGRARASALEARLDSHAASLLGQLSPDQDSQLADILKQILMNLDPKRCPSRDPCSEHQVQYRRARPSDWPRIQELLQNASLPTEDAVDHLDRFTVGVDATDLVAAAAFESHGPCALLRSFVVAPQLRGRR
jgi:hypothetical protein